MQIINHIEVRDGIGYITGRNIKAKLVARLHLWENTPIEDVMAQYQLSAAEAHAALAYYYDNQQLLDEEFADNIKLMQSIGISSDELLSRIGSRLKGK